MYNFIKRKVVFLWLMCLSKAADIKTKKMQSSVQNKSYFVYLERGGERERERERESSCVFVRYRTSGFFSCPSGQSSGHGDLRGVVQLRN